jgi:hypothetical protein
MSLSLNNLSHCQSGGSLPWVFRLFELTRVPTKFCAWLEAAREFSKSLCRRDAIFHASDPSDSNMALARITAVCIFVQMPTEEGAGHHRNMLLLE